MAGHDLSQKGSASLDVYGGLITFALPKDLPEGASPRCVDCDFAVGSVLTRPGLQSVYTYATTLNISQVVFTSGSFGIFTYTGAVAPTINEPFLLSGITGPATFLNGVTVLSSVFPLESSWHNCFPFKTTKRLNQIKPFFTS